MKKRLTNIKLEIYSLSRKARKIFSRAYEGLTMFIFYDVKERFCLLMVNEDNLVILEREISRAEAFRIINTRP